MVGWIFAQYGVRRMGGWSSAKMLLDVYAHYLPREMRGFSNSLSASDRTRPDQAVAGQSD